MLVCLDAVFKFIKQNTLSLLATCPMKCKMKSFSKMELLVSRVALHGELVITATHTPTPHPTPRRSSRGPRRATLDLESDRFGFSSLGF